MTRRIPSQGLRLALVLAVLLVSTGCVAPRFGSHLETLGVEYRLQISGNPRPNRVHILRVDLAGGWIQPATVIATDPDGPGPAEASLTDPLRLADDPSVVAFINTNPWDSFPDATGKRNRSWFEGQAVDIRGLAVSGGQVRSLPEPGGASIWIEERGRISLGDIAADKAVIEGTAGFQPIVKAGDVVAVPGGPLHPRTSIGADRSGKVAWLVVVDGRQPHYSEGMTLYELGTLMSDLGCWEATNLDGGGSSVMGLVNSHGKLQVINHPSDRGPDGRTKIRPLPAILTIKRTSRAESPGANGEARRNP